jgi:hypothetical protein
MKKFGLCRLTLPRMVRLAAKATGAAGIDPRVCKRCRQLFFLVLITIDCFKNTVDTCYQHRSFMLHISRQLHVLEESVRGVQP